MVFEAVVKDRQNNRVAPWSSEGTPERRVFAWHASTTTKTSKFRVFFFSLSMFLTTRRPYRVTRRSFNCHTGARVVLDKLYFPVNPPTFLAEWWTRRGRYDILLHSIEFDRGQMCHCLCDPTQDRRSVFWLWYHWFFGKILNWSSATTSHYPLPTSNSFETLANQHLLSRIWGIRASVRPLITTRPLCWICIHTIRILVDCFHSD